MAVTADMSVSLDLVAARHGSIRPGGVPVALMGCPDDLARQPEERHAARAISTNISGRTRPTRSSAGRLTRKSGVSMKVVV